MLLCAEQGASQDQLRTQGKLAGVVLGLECTDRDLYRQGLAITPPAAQELGQESRRPPRGLVNFSLIKGATGDRGPAEASAEPVPGPPSSARPPREASCRPGGLRPPSHVRTLLFPYLSPSGLLQACRETTASKGKRWAKGEERKRGPCPLSQGRFPGPGRSESWEEGRLKAQLQSWDWNAKI